MNRVGSLVMMPISVLVAATVFGVGGYHGTDFLIDRQNRAQLGELTDIALRRAERQADFAFIALGDLVRVGAVGCDPESRVRMRRQVYLRSTLKDIRVVDDSGRILCAAFPETLDFDTDTAAPPIAFPARNSRISLFKLDQRATASIGVLWRVASDLSLVAVLNADALLYDILPGEFQEGSSLRLELPSGQVVAAYSTSEVVAADDAGVFNARSERYPLTARLVVDAAALGGWNKGPEIYLLALGAGIGAAFGYLVGRAVRGRRTILSEIDAALENGEFRPFAQPVFCLRTGLITGCEILARWTKADGTAVSPGQFIPIAEDSGRIVPLTRALMRDALAELRPILSSRRDFAVAFNISPQDFLSAGFVAELTTLLAETMTAPDRVVLEITERQQLHDLERGAVRIKDLMEHGIRVAIDDAGTGHNGLSHMQKLNARILKIDKFFVDAIEIDFSARVIVEMLVKAAGQLGMRTIAEGIERPEQLTWLRDIGVDEGQGFIVSPPVSLGDFVRLIEADANIPAAVA